MSFWKSLFGGGETKVAVPPQSTSGLSLLICDVCNRKFNATDEWFLLSTKEVISSVDWWETALKILVGAGTPLDWIQGNLPVVVARQARSDTPWKICSACSRLFTFDQKKAGDLARSYGLNAEPRRGFALCCYEEKGKDVTIKNIDDDAMMAAWHAAQSALNRWKKGPSRS